MIIDTNQSIYSTLNSPKTQVAFELSAPHRLLTIALRRGILEGISTIDDLFNGNKLNITIKKEFLDKPVLVAGGPRGLSVDLDQPLSSWSLTEYLSLRGKKVGFTKAITFYSLRRNAAQDLSTAIGSEKTRAIMAHDPESTILERYYIADRTNLIDLTALLVDGEDGKVDNRRQSLSITKLNHDRLKKMGPALNVLTNQLRETDEEYPHFGSTAEKKNRDRVIRRAAFRSLMQDLDEEQTREMTADEANRRIDDAQSMSHAFNQRLLEQAREFIDNTQEGSNQETGQPVDNDSNNRELLGISQESGQVDQPEDDAEVQFRAQIENNQRVQTYPDEMADIPDQISSLDYATAARAAMEIWLVVGTVGSKFGTRQHQHVGVPCRLCQEDDTVDDGMKAKLYLPSKVGRHEKSDFHSGLKQFMRRAVNKAQREGIDGVQCEICARLAPDDVEVPPHATIRTLTRHIETSDNRTLRAAEADHRWWREFDDEVKQQLTTDHDGIKRELGWYNDDFRGDVLHKAKMRAGQRSRAYRREAETEVTMEFADHIRQIDPVPVPAWTGMQLGSTPGDLIEYIRRESSHFIGDRPDSAYYISQNRTSLLRVGPRDEAAISIPPQYQSRVLVEPYTPGNLTAARNGILKRHRGDDR